MKILWTLVSLAALAFAFVVTLMIREAPAAVMPVCTTVNDVKSDIVKFRIVPTVTEMGSAETHVFLSRFNAYLPNTEFVGDYAVVMSDNQKPNVAVILFDRGCFSNIVYVSRDKLQIILEAM